MAGGIAQVMVGCEDDTGLCGLGDHAARAIERQRKRLFAENMLAGPCGGNCLVAMQFVRRRDVDRIDARIGNEFVERQRAIGSDLLWSTPEELAMRLKNDTEEALRIARELKLSPGS